VGRLRIRERSRIAKPLTIPTKASAKPCFSGVVTLALKCRKRANGIAMITYDTIVTRSHFGKVFDCKGCGAIVNKTVNTCTGKRMK
jgi:hypothetical protein